MLCVRRGCTQNIQTVHRSKFDRLVDLLKSYSACIHLLLCRIIGRIFLICFNDDTCFRFNDTGY